MNDRKDPYEAADAFRQLISATIRDLCHAYLAVSDRGDHDSCVRTLMASRKALHDAFGDSPPRPQRKGTGISGESLRMTLGGIVDAAQKIILMFEAVEETETPEGISRWLSTRGRDLTKGLSFLIGDLLCEDNLRKIALKYDTAN